MREMKLKDIIGGWGFRLSWPCGVLKVHESDIEVVPDVRHRDKLINQAISELQGADNISIKQLGRSMALLQLAAEIEIIRTACKDCRENMLIELDNPPLKTRHLGWIAPGVEYLKGQLRVKDYVKQ